MWGLRGGGGEIAVNLQSNKKTPNLIFRPFNLFKYTKTRPNTDGFRKNNVNYWVFREIGNIILHL